MLHNAPLLSSRLTADIMQALGKAGLNHLVPVVSKRYEATGLMMYDDYTIALTLTLHHRESRQERIC